MRRSLAVTGTIGADEAWERYAVISRWPSWAVPILRVESSAPRLTAGVTGVVHGLGGLRVGFVVDAVDEAARCWSRHVHAGPLALRLEHEVLARTGGGSVATLTVMGPAPVVLVYPDLARLALHRLVHPPRRVVSNDDLLRGTRARGGLRCRRRG